MRSALASCLALVAVDLLGQSAQAQLLEKKALSLEAARKMVRAAESEADRNHWCSVVAVVDDGGWIPTATAPHSDSTMGRYCYRSKRTAAVGPRVAL